MSVDLSNVPTHLTLAVGERIVIPLPSYAGSGNFWSIRCRGRNSVVDARVELDRSPREPVAEDGGTTEPPQPVLVAERLVVSGLAVGEDLCQLVLSRSFGHPAPSASRELRIAVAASVLPQRPPTE
jgi:hypothetical protein